MEVPVVLMSLRSSELGIVNGPSTTVLSIMARTTQQIQMRLSLLLDFQSVWNISSMLTKPFAKLSNATMKLALIGMAKGKKD